LFKVVTAGGIRRIRWAEQLAPLKKLAFGAGLVVPGLVYPIDSGIATKLFTL